MENERLNEKSGKSLLKGKYFLLFFLWIFLILHESILSQLLHGLVRNDSLKKMEAIIVLDGGTGNRIREAARLFHEGYAEYIVFCGFASSSGGHRDKLLEEQMVALGVPRGNIISGPAEGETSTWGEGLVNLRLLEINGIKNFILVTTNFHTKRAGWVYDHLKNKADFDYDFIVRSAQDKMVTLDGWWKNPFGARVVFSELAKHIYYRLNYD